MAKKSKSNERKPLFMNLCVGKENREVEAKDHRAGGKLAEFNRVFRENMNDIMKINILFTLFALPFLLLTIWALGYMLNLSDARFYIGGLGLDYHPGVTNELQQALLARLDVHLFYFALLIPSFTIIGLGLSGAMYVARKMFYKEKGKLLKTFGQGIKKYWWKMMLLTTVIGVIVFLIAFMMIEFFRAELLGTVTGGWYAILFFAFLFAVMILYVLFQLAPQIVTYDTLKFRQKLKNAFIFAIENFVWTTIFMGLILVPILLVVYVQMFGILIYMLMLLLGFMFFIMMNLQIGNYSFDLYLNPMYDVLGEGEVNKKVRKSNKKVKNNAAGQSNDDNKNQTTKKPAQPQKYVNPKKKKSQKKK